MKKVEPIRDLDDIERMKKYLRSKSERNYVLFMFGIYSGLRVSDIIPLQVKQVTVDRIEVKETKTGKVRRFPINPALRKSINQYIKDNDLQDYDYLFPSKKKVRSDGVRITHIGRVAAYQILKEAADHIGLVHIGTHSMRKTFGYHHYKQNGNVAALMEIFNHSSPDITLGYIGYKQDELDASMLSFSY
ncbi:site-specific recombinase (phage integrase family) [Streptococcus sp. DD10]|uniref:site-specific integrase n=1 Tax=Streptococcus sp. DD10 TaxID=1777878 RepID=UPI000798BE0C|nr:site-specific integrase [Streptococcus sp. DD10]KXT73265.1 site-specific recombinase (phage integrase family) [Streptococcus sp. DD10]